MEELIIRVKIDGFEGTRGENRGEGGGNVAATIAAANLLGSQGQSIVSYKGQNAINKVLQKYGAENITFKADPSKVERTEQGLFRATYRVPGSFSSERVGQFLQASPMTRMYEGSYVDEYIRENFTPQRLAAMGSAAAWKAVSAYSSISQHRSGDSYYNAQLQNGIRLASYGVALASSGPFAPIVAAGIAVNEGVNAIVGAVNFNYDRKFNGRQIQNIKLLAGDVSYGRNRGGI